MTKNKWSEEYVRGVNDFLEFAFNNETHSGKIRCPCTRCANGTSWVRGMVHAHLINYGICQRYTCWYAHGEQLGTTSSHQATNTHFHREPIHNSSSGMLDMLHEVFSIVTDPNMSQCPISEMGGEAEGVHKDRQGTSQRPISEMGGEVEGVHEDRQGTSQGTEKFYEFLNDAKKPLYEGCTEYTKFTAIVDLYNLKCMSGWSNNSFTLLLEKLSKMLPPNASLPSNTYQVKKYMKELGLGYEKILVCRNGCMLFWKDNENLENCTVCGKSKWKAIMNVAKSSKKSKKILRWFPLKSRLQRLFMSSKTALDMKWHAENRTNDGVLRHLADALAWKAFDSQYPNFASD
ncbi:uncharacterized protein LOC132162018 [Corylus avellana]|uniref:uncharacterized protein LOC132162018 n=1 Tax=Corylus avellana TaxID=13451 RepID=UPI00286D21DA|nr:uncharacterized protein LOC132162018 [Corylus avellana]